MEIRIKLSSITKDTPNKKVDVIQNPRSNPDFSETISKLK